jgi:hypothetical protein
MMTIFLASDTQASLIFSQSGNEITMFVNETYTLTTDQTDDILYVAFQDVFPSGGDAVLDSSRVGGYITYSINGGTATTASWWGGWQYRPGSQGDWTSEDAAFLLDMESNTLLAGDTFSIIGSLTMNSSLDSNVIMSDVTSALTVLGGHSSFYSAPKSTSVIPEPAVLGLVSVVGCGMLFVRRIFSL